MRTQRGTHTPLTAWGATGLAGLLLFGLAGCKSNSAPAPIIANGDQGANGDPADANTAPYTGGTAGGYAAAGSTSTAAPASAPKTRVLSSSQSYPAQASGESYGSESYGYDQSAGPPPTVGQGYGDPQGYSDAEEAGAEAIADTDQAPPPLPEYDQPPDPQPNDLWTPGYWNYQPTGYYWVPGAWVAPPYYGALWTPPWWGYYSNHWMFHRGYWGPHVGFYGGVDYGFGYIGTGYYGGYWRGNDFVYNRAVTNVNINIIHNVYERPVVYDGRHYGPQPLNRVSYNGGRGGLTMQPRPSDLAALHEPHYAPTAAQQQARVAAAGNRAQFFKDNGGRPAQAFANHGEGPRDIAAAPHEQPFNRAALVPGAARPDAFRNQPAPANRPAPGTPAAGGFRPNEPANRGAVAPNNRMETAPHQPGVAPADRHEPGNVNRPGAEPAHGNPGVRPAPEAPRPAAPAMRPAPAAPANRPAPVERPEMRPNPANRPEARPAPVERPEAQPRAFPAQRPEERPAPEARPMPEARPAPTPRPAPEARPMPEARPAPAPRPAPEARPMPEARPAPAPRPAPEPHGGSAPHEGGHR